jgi:hypothetical protein
MKYCKDGKTIKKSGGKRHNAGVKSKFQKPFPYTFTTDEDRIISLKLKYNKRLNILINDFLVKLDKKS